MPKSEDFVLGKWVRSQLEKGDDPSVIKQALKNRGMSPDIVDTVISSLKKNPPRKKEQAQAKTPEKLYNNALKGEVDRILASAKSASVLCFSAQAQAGEKSKDSRQNPETALLAGEKRVHENKKEAEKTPEEESIFSLFARRISEKLSEIHVKLPNVLPLFLNGRVVIFLGIVVAILIVSFLISSGLEFYAERMAERVLI